VLVRDIALRKWRPLLRKKIPLLAEHKTLNLSFARKSRRTRRRRIPNKKIVKIKF
jgi:hypothetical protein